MAPPAWAYIDFSQPSLWLCIGSILFNPTFWNLVARNEHQRHTIERTVGSPYLGCYLLAVTIFSLGILRDSIYHDALAHQPQLPFLGYGEFKGLAMILFASGSTLVASSMWKLGVTGTYLGDYFGILMDDKVDSFPFNVTGSPMYDGSTLSFLGTALWYKSPAGLFLTAIVFLAYRVALRFEDPYTESIYAAREQQSKTGTSTTPKRRAIGAATKKDL